jgi:hypothetical protein
VFTYLLVTSAFAFSAVHHFESVAVATMASFVTQIFHSGQPSHGGNRNTFEVMNSRKSKS